MDDSLIGQEIAGYRIVDGLGRGGMATVYLAIDTRLDRKVALKVLSPHLSIDDRFRRRIIRESRIAASLDHPNIIPIYEAGDTGRLVYIAMRYVVGKDLRMTLEERGHLAIEPAKKILSQIAAALDTAHAGELVHRDVKPANILITDSSHAYLSDFGITRHGSGAESLTLTNQMLGTPRYMAPEQINNMEVDGRCDQYALACVAYEMLADRPPFSRASDFAMLRAHLDDRPEPLTDLRPELPVAVDQVMARAMAKSPEDRYPSCEAFATALDDSISGRKTVPFTRIDPAAPEGWPRPHVPATPRPRPAPSQPRHGSPPRGARSHPHGAGSHPPGAGRFPRGATPPPAPATNSSAVAALVLGILSFVTCGATAPIGIVFGHIALYQLNRKRERGFEMATAGLVISYVVGAVALIFLLLAALTEMDPST